MAPTPIRPASWLVLPWSPCSASCNRKIGQSGGGGVQTRERKCQQNGLEVVVDLCEASGSGSGSGFEAGTFWQQRACNQEVACPTASYQYKPVPVSGSAATTATSGTDGWSECSAYCGGGIQFRSLACVRVNSYSGANSTAASSTTDSG